MAHEVAVNLPVGRAYEYVRTMLPQVYRQMAIGHERFEIRGGGAIRMGAIIDCVETCANQTASHEYHVLRVEPDKTLRYRSDPTRVVI